MVIKTFITLCAVLSVAHGICFAQVNFPYKETMSDMRIDFPKYNLPKGYVADNEKWIRIYPQTQIDDRISVGYSLCGSISSTDSSFLLLMKVLPLHAFMDSSQNKGWLLDTEEQRQENGYGMGFWRTWKPNEYHINELLYLLSFQQKTFTFDKDTLVHYYTHVQAHTMFNADTVIRVDIDLPRFYDGKPTFTHENRDYNHMQAYVIHRHNRGFFILFCFTNDIGQRDFDKHFKAMQQIFRYKDDE